MITGANATEYLLEKSRIVTQAPEERNFHVFYEILAGMPKEQKEVIFVREKGFLRLGNTRGKAPERRTEGLFTIHA